MHNIPLLYRRYSRLIPGVKSYVLATIFVFILGAVITVLSWYVDKQRLQAQNRIDITNQATAFESDLNSRLIVYEQILRGATALFSASDDVTRDEWHKFVQRYDIQNDYPGLTGVGYISHVRPNEVDNYVQGIKNEGIFPQNFKIFPEGSRPVYGPITYIEPFSEYAKKFIGADAFVNKERIDAANRARDTGEVGMTNKITLLGDQNDGSPNHNEASFGIYIATYKNDAVPTNVEERRELVTGYVFATSRANNFFKRAIDTSNFKAYKAVRIYDGNSTDESALLYESPEIKEVNQDTASQVFTFNNSLGRAWTYRFVGEVEPSAQESQRANMILIGGFTISAALAGFLFLVMLTRARDIAYAKQNEAQQAKDDLLSLASHQLRTPATAVKQYLGMILEGYTGEVDEKQLPALQKAFASNERQLETINQILYVAKADAGRLSISKTVFDLNLLVDDIVLEMDDAVEANGQKLIFERSSKQLKVCADESSLRMVIENLISNASKYSHNDTTVTVKTGVRDQHVYISVKDQGVGIAPDDFDKLFKKFSRIDNDKSLQVGGSGIGLYIDKVLVELHKGKILVDSELGKGTIFTILLPKNIESNLTDSGKKDRSI